MKQVIPTDLSALAQPFSWAVRAGGMVFTTHGPVKHYGRMELGPIDLPTVDAVYREHFQAPYPNRSAVAVWSLAVPGMRIELVACACIDAVPSALRTWSRFTALAWTSQQCRNRTWRDAPIFEGVIATWFARLGLRCGGRDV